MLKVVTAEQKEEMQEAKLEPQKEFRSRFPYHTLQGAYLDENKEKQEYELRFKDGVFMCETKWDLFLLEHCILNMRVEQRGVISAIDKEAAAELVKQHMAKRLAENAAVQGPFGADNMIHRAPEIFTEKIAMAASTEGLKVAPVNNLLKTLKTSNANQDEKK